MINVELQYFNGCPNSQKLIDNTKGALDELGENVNYIEVLVDSPEKANEAKFRGSPTLLVNNIDFESMEEPESPSLACRFYQNGIPSSSNIKEFILRDLLKLKTK
ncbi:MAG TPA: DUF2703 domain-containing protein [Bacteroidetes bacterium]|nr:DUF2703 domain-containing protein [Bacteroidota bacterium]